MAKSSSPVGISQTGSPRAGAGGCVRPPSLPEPAGTPRCSRSAGRPGGRRCRRGERRGPERRGSAPRAPAPSPGAGGASPRRFGIDPPALQPSSPNPKTRVNARASDRSMGRTVDRFIRNRLRGLATRTLTPSTSSTSISRSSKRVTSPIRRLFGIARRRLRLAQPVLLRGRPLARPESIWLSRYTLRSRRSEQAARGVELRSQCRGSSPSSLSGATCPSPSAAPCAPAPGGTAWSGSSPVSALRKATIASTCASSSSWPSCT